MWLLYAFSGPIMWALSTHIDKFLVDKYFRDSDTAVLMVFTALLGVIALPVIWFFDPKVLGLSLTATVVMTLSGILYMGAMLFYLLTYALTTVGAFGVTALVATRDRENDDLADYAGLSKRQPLLALVMTIFLLSLGGFPPTAGFIGKWYLFSAAVTSGDYGLAIIGVLTSVVSVFFYIRVVVMMYMSERQGVPAPARISAMGMAALTVAIIAIFYLGILPTPVLNLAAESIATIF